MQRVALAAGLLAAALGGCDNRARVVEVPVKVERTVVELQILPNGDTLWNGQRIDEASLNKRFARVANESLPVEFRLKADQRADFEKVARVLSDAQRSGVIKIGFVNERPH